MVLQDSIQASEQSTLTTLPREVPLPQEQLQNFSVFWYILMHSALESFESVLLVDRLQYTDHQIYSCAMSEWFLPRGHSLTQKLAECLMTFRSFAFGLGKQPERAISHEAAKGERNWAIPSLSWWGWAWAAPLGWPWRESIAKADWDLRRSRIVPCMVESVEVCLSISNLL